MIDAPAADAFSAAPPSAAAAASGRGGFLKRQGATTLVAGMILFAGMLGAALAAPVLTSYQPSRNNITARLHAPFWEKGSKGSTKHLLGTDGLGRDMLSRMLYGIRVSLALASAGLLVSMALGVTI